MHKPFNVFQSTFAEIVLNSKIATFDWIGDWDYNSAQTFRERVKYERAAKVYFGPAHSRGNRISYDGSNAITVGPSGPIFLPHSL